MIPHDDALLCVGPGWSGLINRAYDARPDDVSVIQVKEKFGGPRIYVDAAPDDYYDLLALNKARFAYITSPATHEKRQVGGGRTNEDFIIRLLKAREIRYFHGFTDADEDYLAAVLKALRAGIIPRNTTKRLRNEINAAMKGGFSPLKVLHLLKQNIPDTLLYTPAAPQHNPNTAKREVILSEYFVEEGEAI